MYAVKKVHLKITKEEIVRKIFREVTVLAKVRLKLLTHQLHDKKKKSIFTIFFMSFLTEKLFMKSTY